MTQDSIAAVLDARREATPIGQGVVSDEMLQQALEQEIVQRTQCTLRRGMAPTEAGLKEWRAAIRANRLYFTTDMLAGVSEICRLLKEGRATQFEIAFKNESFGEDNVYRDSGLLMLRYIL